MKCQAPIVVPPLPYMVYPEKGTATLVFESSEIVDALAIFVRPIFTANKVNKNNEKIFNFLAI